MTIWLRAFLSGYASTLVFHQGALWLLNVMGQSPRSPFPTNAVPPFGVPAVISLAFWGGVWGLPLLWFIRNKRARVAPTVAAILFGAVAPSLVALAVVMPLKGGPFMGGWDPKIFLGALILNGAWGLGTKVFLGK